MNHNNIPWRIANSLLGLGSRPELMGIVNCTPDSFFDGGRHNSCDAAWEHALQLLEEGATILDIGGESSRPGAEMVSVEEEIQRVLPVIERLAQLQKERRFFISIDTVKASVASAAIAAGAQIVNDISMTRLDPDMAQLIAATGVSVVLNHMRGDPRSMQVAPHFDDVVAEVKAELLQAAHSLEALGVSSAKICLDPGIGFGKRFEDNYALIGRAREFHDLGYPLLFGMSRKSYIGRTPGLEQSDRLIPSVVSAVMVAQQGVCVLRVHDVAATREAMVMLGALGGNRQ
jgi:dihydropteroate synthase